ncbi:MAG: sulfate ABC transporter substrate-binding protein, partial [Solirubrobacterales bacterium]
NEINKERPQASMSKGKKKRHPGRLVARLGIGVVALGATVGVAACGSSGSSLSLVAYSTPQQVYEQGLEPAFKKTSDGKDVDFSNSFGASGDQSRAVESGQPADVVEFSLQPDMQRLVDAGIVSADWDQNQYKGIVTDSVVTLMVRPGNPKHITSFDDLAKPDVDVIDPNPATSGGARWNIMAIYGSQIAEGKSPAEAQAFVKQVLANTSVQDSSARDSLNTFSSGKGDVLVGYENDAIQAKKDGIDLDYVTPASTILIENPIAVTKDAPSEAQKFVDFLYTDQGQQDFADAGYRPVVKSVADKNASKFPTPSGLFTIDKFGGWDKVADPFFGDNGWVIQAEKDLGNPTS